MTHQAPTFFDDADREELEDVADHSEGESLAYDVMYGQAGESVYARRLGYQV